LKNVRVLFTVDIMNLRV